MRKMGPFKVLQKCGTNAYKLELLADIGLSNTFNVSNLYPYKGSVVCDTGQIHGEEVPVQLPKQPQLEVECILDTKVLRSTRRKTINQYLVKWRN